MLLTLKPPFNNGIKSPHELFLNSKSSYSPPMIPGGLPPAPDPSDRRMSNTHRGLPPPSAMSLPPPERPPADRGLPGMAPLGQLPGPPSQWQGAEDSMRNWLLAKAEEDRRKQEEERTRQEGLRLDQRKIEQSMLRESLSGGVPPVMVPLIFAGMGGGSLPNSAVEWAQHYLAQMSLQTQQQAQQVQQQQQQLQQAQQATQGHHPPSEPRRDNRMIPPNPYGSQPPLQPAPQASQPQYGRPTGTGELQIQAPPSGAASQALHSIHQPPSAQQEQQTSQGIYFHHWVPPDKQSSGNQPPTPSNKSQHGSPFSQSQQSHLRSDYQNSPKKRKATGTHHPPPAPTSQPGDRSPPYSQASSTGTDEARREGPHSRQASAGSSSRGYDAVPRPSSHQQRQEAMSGGASGSLGQITEPKPYTPGSSSHSSEPSMQASVQSETRQNDQSRYAEMRHSIPAMTTTPKRED